MRVLGLKSAGPASALVALLFAPLPRQASAGLLDFFGNSYQPQPLEGRHLVSFPPAYEPGMILVPFSQRRLYFVLPQQRAISFGAAGRHQMCMTMPVTRTIRITVITVTMRTVKPAIAWWRPRRSPGRCRGARSRRWFSRLALGRARARS
jgi:hypothetical protein